jgi:hypothetical protein
MVTKPITPSFQLETEVKERTETPGEHVLGSPPPLATTLRYGNEDP